MCKYTWQEKEIRWWSTVCHFQHVYQENLQSWINIFICIIHWMWENGWLLFCSVSFSYVLRCIWICLIPVPLMCWTYEFSGSSTKYWWQKYNSECECMDMLQNQKHNKMISKLSYGQKSCSCVLVILILESYDVFDCLYIVISVEIQAKQAHTAFLHVKCKLLHVL